MMTWETESNVVVFSKTSVNPYDGDYILLSNMMEALQNSKTQLKSKVGIYTSANCYQHNLNHRVGIHVKWLYSHPEAYSLEYLKKFNCVMCSSSFYVKKLIDKGLKVFVLEEAGVTPKTVKEWSQRELSYVHIGNHKPYRQLVLKCIKDNNRVHVYGLNWQGQIPDECLNKPVGYKESMRIYDNAKHCIDDHHGDMAKLGFLGQRAFNASLCGCSVITDIQNYEGVWNNQHENTHKFSWTYRITELLNILRSL